jgi:hypothetical protein
MRKRLWMAVALLGSGLAITPFFTKAADPPTEPIQETEVLMRAKLSSSQNVLEGLLSEDFQLIGHAARQMKKISEAAEWPRARDAVYEHFATEFRRQCSKLEHLAAQRNHEAASFTYLQMTTTCIDCHNYIREGWRMADTPDGGVQLIPIEVPN